MKSQDLERLIEKQMSDHHSLVYAEFNTELAYFKDDVGKETAWLVEIAFGNEGGWSGGPTSMSNLFQAVRRETALQLLQNRKHIIQRLGKDKEG